MVGLWMVYGWFMDGLWMVYGWFMDGLWISDVELQCFSNFGS
jgi:hypothetical protein